MVLHKAVLEEQKEEQNTNSQPEAESRLHIVNDNNEDNIVNDDDDDDDDDDEDDEESELDRMVRQLGPCAAAYWEMDRCREAHNHQWTKCQSEVKKLKECFDANEGSSQSAAVQNKRMAMVMMMARNKSKSKRSSSSSGSSSGNDNKSLNREK